MSVIFPSGGWLKAMDEKLNSDSQYAEIAKNWEGNLKEQVAGAEAATVIPVLDEQCVPGDD